MDIRIDLFATQIAFLGSIWRAREWLEIRIRLLNIGIVGDSSFCGTILRNGFTWGNSDDGSRAGALEDILACKLLLGC